MKNIPAAIRKQLQGGSAPRPPGFNALRPPAAMPTKKAASFETTPAVWPPTGARVASQRCPILRPDDPSVSEEQRAGKICFQCQASSGHAMK